MPRSPPSSLTGRVPSSFVDVDSPRILKSCRSGELPTNPRPLRCWGRFKHSVRPYCPTDLNGRWRSADIYFWNIPVTTGQPVPPLARGDRSQLPVAFVMRIVRAADCRFPGKCLTTGSPEAR